MSGRPWTKREDDYVRRNVDRKTCAAIGEKIGRTRHAVTQRLHALGLRYTKRIARNPPNAWSKEEIKFLRSNLNRMTCREIGMAIGRSKIAINAMRNVLGLKRTPAARKRMIDAGLYKLHHNTWNKGLKGIHLSPTTEFKKGNKPAQTKWDGAITIRWHRPTNTPYKYIRVAEGKWELLSQWKWKKYRGKIPPKHVVVYKNGDTLNCRLSNLSLLSRAENIRRNSNPQKAGLGIKKAWDEGRFIASDKYIAFTLAPKDERLREEVKKYPAFIEAKRTELKLRRSLKNATRTAT